MTQNVSLIERLDCIYSNYGEVQMEIYYIPRTDNSKFDYKPVINVNIISTR